ncbi:MAG: MFS transporter [Gammaproteobacteria bacterium]|nr:MFS transporter [Gammaproteobacteria bacterium]
MLTEQRYSNRYIWYVVFVLTIASTVSFIDRQILNVMIGPVKRDLGGISDTQVSLIMGLAFTLFYNALSIPMGRLADRANRRNLMVWGIAGWSVMTSLCGVASQYWQLFLARMGVGIGEATLGPAANSSLADLFTRASLPIAIGFVSAAPFIGQGLANMLGGPLIDYLEAAPNVHLPLIGEVFSWQMVFIVVGMPGLLVALLVLTTREPRREGRLQNSDSSVPAREVWAFVKKRGLLFFLMFTAYLGLSTQGFSLFSWLVEYYVRNHGWTRTEIGLTYGTIAMVVGITGSVFAGWIAGRWIAGGTPDATLRIVMWTSVGLLPSATAFTLMPEAHAAIWILIPVTFLMAMPSGLMMTTLQAIAPNELRGQMVAFYLLAVNFLSYTFAPSLPAVLSDYVFESELALGKSISLLAVINYSVAIVCLAACLPAYRRALAEADTWYRKTDDEPSPAH